MRKKLLAVLLSVVMIVGVVPMTLMAASSIYPVTGGNIYYNYIYYPDNRREIEITGCDKSVLGVTIPSSINDIEVTTIGPAFYNCSGLTRVTIPSSVTRIKGSAFNGCSSLKSIIIPNSVTSIGNSAFKGCSSLKSITIPSSVTNIGNGVFEDCVSMNSIEIQNGVTSIGDYAFQGCSSLKSITIPSSVMNIGMYAFKDCVSMNNIEIQNGVTSIGNSAFNGCSSLKSITIPSSVTNIGNGVFNDCGALESINVDSGNTAYSTIDGILFNKSKTEIILFPVGKADTSYTIPNGVTSIGNSAFMDCSSLTAIEIPDSMTSIGDFAFDRCSSLTTIEMPNSVTSIGEYAFGYCSNLASIEIPSNIIRIETNAFIGCSSLTSVEIPEGVKAIMTGAFEYCSSLERIEIPYSMMSINTSAFYGCSSLKDVFYNGILREWNNIYIYSLNESLTNATIHFKEPINVIFDKQGSSTSVQNKSVINGRPYGMLQSPYKAGYKFVGWYTQKDGGSLVTEDTIVTAESEHTLYAHWEKLYNVLVTAGINGTASVNQTFAIVGDNITVTAMPENGFAIDNITYTPAGGSTIDITIEKSFTMPDKDVMVNVTFAKEKHRIIVNTGEGGVAMSTMEYAKEGETVRIMALTDEEYQVDKVTYTYDGGEVIDITNAMSFIMPAADVTVNATFRKIGEDPIENEYTITWKNDDGTVIDTTTVAYGETPTHVDPVKPADEQYTYTFAGWSPEITAVAGDAEYTATYTPEKITFTITVTEPVNGTASASVLLASKGEEITITAIPDSGYEIDKITYTPAGGSAIDITIEKSFTMPDKDVTVNVTFKEKPLDDYAIGDINGDGDVTQTDKLILSRYLAKWDGYENKILNWDAADINGDGDVTQTDKLILSRYLAKWDGYDRYFN
ncbi:MAG: leucine-rich repeat protein [Firmicutes bacterium]|nr:leucine-rich repeat protein [Bacillota bacterium]